MADRHKSGRLLLLVSVLEVAVMVVVVRVAEVIDVKVLVDSVDVVLMLVLVRLVRVADVVDPVDVEVVTEDWVIVVRVVLVVAVVVVVVRSTGKTAGRSCPSPQFTINPSARTRCKSRDEEAVMRCTVSTISFCPMHKKSILNNELLGRPWAARA